MQKKNNWTYLYTNRFYLAYIQKSTKTLFNLWLLNVHFNVWKNTVQSIYIYSFFRTDSSASARYDYCNQRNEYTIQTPIVTLTCDHAKDDTTNFPSCFKIEPSYKYSGYQTAGSQFWKRRTIFIKKGFWWMEKRHDIYYNMVVFF